VYGGSLSYGRKIFAGTRRILCKYIYLEKKIISNEKKQIINNKWQLKRKIDFIKLVPRKQDKSKQDQIKK
jgi:hypothetical protein